MQIIIWSNKTMVNLWLPWLQEHGNSKRILRQMLMVKLLDIININSQKSFTGLWTYMKMMHGLHLGLFSFSFLGPGLLMSFPGHSFRSFMIICIQPQIWREGGRERERRCGKGASHVLSYCVHFLSLYIYIYIVHVYIFIYVYVYINIEWI